MQQPNLVCFICLILDVNITRALLGKYQHKVLVAAASIGSTKQEEQAVRTAIFFPCSMYVLRSACIVYPLHGSCFVSGVVEFQHLSRVHSTLLMLTAKQARRWNAKSLNRNYCAKR